MQVTTLNAAATALLLSCSLTAGAASMDGSTAKSNADAKTFKAIDVNGDGKISRQEAQQQVDLSATFSTLDKDRDGTLSQSEFSQWKSDGKAATGAVPGANQEFNDQGSGPGQGTRLRDRVDGVDPNGVRSGPGSGIE